MEESNQLLQQNRKYGYLLKGVFAAIDGGMFPYVDYGDRNIRNVYNEGYTCSGEVTNLFVYNFKGETKHASI